MGIAGFSPFAFRTPGMSVLLAPVQALVAFFIPVQPVRASYRPVARLPVQRILNAQHTGKHPPIAASAHPIVRLKVVREFDPCNKRAHAGRMVISGRMADVCAELDRIALKESA